jgi:hypothetical protein
VTPPPGRGAAGRAPAPTLDAIRECLEGATPGVIATCAADGTPNVAYLSQIHYVDPAHVALSFQFFNKTRANVLANPLATLFVLSPTTAAAYRLSLRYLRTETEGPLFESMKARLAGIASHTGMADVFRLKGSDVYRLEAIERIPGPAADAAPARGSLLPAVRACAQRLAACTGLDALFDAAMAALHEHLGIEHAMLLLPDSAGRRLYTVASLGYPASGVGSEIAVGAGVIGVAARERTPIRIMHANAEYAYARSVLDSLGQEGMAGLIETAIPLPGLAHPHSQLAVPVLAGEQLMGVLYVESEEALRFGFDDEDALAALAAQLGASIRWLQACADVDDDVLARASARSPAAARGAASGEAGPAAVSPGGAVSSPSLAATAGGAPALLRHYPADGSVFLDGDYVIKGVAGWILWLLLQDLVERGRTEFTNRELRLDPRARLPDVGDNLEARLILLQRRLVERDACVRLEKTGRGRFRVALTRPLRLEAIG